jgi:hypothetical protein
MQEFALNVLVCEAVIFQNKISLRLYGIGSTLIIDSCLRI